MELFGSAPLWLAIVAMTWLPADSKQYDYECETRTGNFEGDIVLTERQQEVVITGRDPIITEVDRWANNRVPYVIDTEFLTPEHATLIRSAMSKIEDVGTVRFVPRQQDRDFLIISGESSGCWSTLGRNRGLNRMNISPSECMLEGAIVHQLLHVLGFGHVTNQQDRDYHLDINWHQAQPQRIQNLLLHEGRIIPNYGIPFDIDSIMHFGPKHFSRNGMETIVPKNRDHTIGQRETMSLKDIRKLNMMYPCGNC